MNNFVFTSESASEGHPDKICDQISDAILDAYLKEDPKAHTAIETVVVPHRVYVFGEVKSSANITRKHIDEIIRERVRDIGYEAPNFDWRVLATEVDLKTQSPEITFGVEDLQGAGDQGLMFGYAANENEALMPTPLYFSQNLLRLIAYDRKRGILPELGPDGKSQFSILYTHEHKPIGTSAIVISHQHQEGLTSEDIKALVRPYVEKVLPEGWFCSEENFLVNPTGRFVAGGPESDVGLTGRKIIVDTYGGMAPHGGGAFSGKDPTKVDRSASYIARYMAKNIVKAGLAKRCTIQISYAIGRADPTSFYINTHRTGLVSEERLATILREMVDLTPLGIIERLKLRHPLYTKTAAYGHFGREPTPDGGFSWEKEDLVEELKGAFL